MDDYVNMDKDLEMGVRLKFFFNGLSLGDSYWDSHERDLLYLP